MEAATQPAAGEGAGPSPVGEGHGRRLTHALEALEAFPALSESRDRLLRVVGEDQPSPSEMVSTVECDPALVRVALQSLLSNALKFTRPRDHAVITIRPIEHEGQAGIAVQDNPRGGEATAGVRSCP